MKHARLAVVGVTAILATVAYACSDDEPTNQLRPNGTSSSSSSGGGGPTDGAVAVDGATEGGTLTGLSATFVHYDINHVLGTGQSLSVGAAGAPVLSATQPYTNLMFSNGVLAGATNLTGFVPLVEGAFNDGGTGIAAETLSAGFANLISKMASEQLLVGQPVGKTSHDLLVSAHGAGGVGYVGLKKGSVSYAAGLAQTKAAFDLAKAQNKSYIVRAITNVHGETDHITANQQYQANLTTWQSDYENDVKAITGQADSIPMLQSQMSSYTKLTVAGEDTPSSVSTIPKQQLAAHITSSGKVVLVGPKYHLPYALDGLHLTNEGYRQMGEDYAKVYRHIILEGKKWEPLRPTSISRDGAVITIKFVVPKPPLTFDETLVTNPGNKGFEYTEGPVPDGGVAVGIQTITTTAPDTVTITLTGVPSSAPKRIRYAFTGTPGNAAGPQTGPRGNLRDSDATPSRNGYPLHNWCVHFDEAVP